MIKRIFILIVFMPALFLSAVQILIWCLKWVVDGKSFIENTTITEKLMISL